MFYQNDRTFTTVDEIEGQPKMGGCLITGENNECSVFNSSNKNKFFLHCDWDTLSIGSGGDGPAIRLKENVANGSTSACETFDSPILIHNGVKHVDDAFEAQNVEFFIL